MSIRTLAAVVIVLAVTLPAYGHGGAGDHSHDAPDLNTPAVAAPGAPSISAHGTEFDLTIAYAPFHSGEQVPLDLFLADWHTNEPVSGATIELTMTGPETRTVVPVRPTDEPGRYRAVVEGVGSGSYSFLADISVDGAFDLITPTGFQADHVEEHQDESRTRFDAYEYGVYIVAAVAVVAGLLGFSMGLAIRRRRATARASSSSEEAK